MKPEDMRSILQTDLHSADLESRALIGFLDIHSENGDVTTRSRVFVFISLLFPRQLRLED